MRPAIKPMPGEPAASPTALPPSTSRLPSNPIRRALLPVASTVISATSFRAMCSRFPERLTTTSSESSAATKLRFRLSPCLMVTVIVARDGWRGVLQQECLDSSFVPCEQSHCHGDYRASQSIARAEPSAHSSHLFCRGTGYIMSLTERPADGAGPLAGRIGNMTIRRP